MAIHPRQKKFLEVLPKNKNKIMPSAIEAGYSKEYARSKGKYIYETAVKAQAKEIISMIEDNRLAKSDAKKFMAEIVGLTRDDVFELLRKIANQNKDYGSALKVLAPLARELGVVLDSDAPKVTVPILQVTTKPSTEPPNERRTIYIDGSIDKEGGSVAPQTNEAES